jgi:uncharacterized protein DUF4282
VGDFFAFRTLITPRFIQILFALGLLGIVLGFVAALSADEAVAGFLLLIFGTLYWRIVCELFYVFFRISDTLVSIKADTTAIAPAVAGQEGPPAAAAIEAGEPTAVTSSEQAAVDPVAEPAAAATPEGWYDDSERPGHKRWWDGTAWGMRDDEHPSAGKTPE